MRSERDLEEELRLEKLRDLQSRRKAREQSETFGLVERAAILLVTVTGLIYTLIHYPQAPPITAVGCILGGGVALIYRQRR
jgi:hypothetical protein